MRVNAHGNDSEQEGIEKEVVDKLSSAIDEGGRHRNAAGLAGYPTLRDT